MPPLRLLSLLLALPLASAELAPLPQDDAYTGDDASNSFSSATPLSNPVLPDVADGPYPGDLYFGEDMDDWYAFGAAEGAVILVPFTVGPIVTGPAGVCPLALATVHAELVDPSGATASTLILAPCAGGGGLLEKIGATAGTWRIHVSIVSGLLGTHRDDPPGPLPEPPVHYGLDLGCDPICVHVSI
jgi:hypothetical protein